MNRNFILAAVLLASSGSTLLHAQTTDAPATRQAPKPDQALKMYTEKLGLTEDQKTRLKPIIADRRQQMMDLRDDTSVQGRDKMKKMKSVMEASDKRINAVLTPDQQKKYAELEAQQHEKMMERRKSRGAN